MNHDSPRVVRVRDLRAIMSLLVLLAAFVCGSFTWFVLKHYVPPANNPILSALTALVPTATGAAFAVLVVGWVIRKCFPVAVVGGSGLLDVKPGAAEHEELLGRIIDSVEGGVMTVGTDGVISSFNTVGQKTLAYEAADVVGRHFGSVFIDVPQNRTLRDMIRAALVTGQTFSSVEVSAVAADGRCVALGVTVSVLRGDGDRFRGIVLMFKDLAELTRIRDQVQRTDQLASLGRLSAGVAHEVRNPLGSLQGLVELIEEDFAQDDPRRQYTATILRTIDQLNALVESLLEFSQPPASDLEPQDVRDIVRDGVRFSSFERREVSVSVEEDYGAEPVLVLADRESLTRAFINIVRNAFQATTDGGTVAVSVRARAPKVVDGPGQASISVRNTGSYVPPEDRENLFTPFFTTKPDGTGLGLAIAHQVVSAHFGEIEVDSRRGDGTTFTIILPVVEAEAMTAAAGQEHGEQDT